MIKIAISKESDHTHPSLSLDVSKFDVNERGIDEKSTQDSLLEEVQRELEVEAFAVEKNLRTWSLLLQ